MYGHTTHDQVITFDSSAAGVTLPAHTQLLVSFDLYIIRSWDGDGANPPPCPGCNAPDRFIVKEGALNRTIFDSTFDNYDYNRVTGPFGVPTTALTADQSFPSPTGNPSNWPAQGAVEINTLGYSINPDVNYPGADGQRMDAVYHIVLPIDHTASSLQIAFTSLGLSALANESWGIDNFCVSVPDATSFGSEFETDLTTWKKGQPSETWTLGGGSLTNPFSSNDVVIKNQSIYFGDVNTSAGTVSSGSFEAAFRRTGGVDCDTCPVSLWIRGTPEAGPNYRSNGWWRTGYLFQITPDSHFSIVKSRYPNAPPKIIVPSTLLTRTNANGVAEPLVHGEDGAQNVLRVDFDLSAVNFYVNGVLVYSTCDFDTEYQSGKVGISIERNKTDFPPSFSIDYARLCNITLPCGHGPDQGGTE